MKKLQLFLILLILGVSIFVLFNQFSIVTLQENFDFAGYKWSIFREGTLRSCSDDPITHPDACATASGNFVQDSGFLQLSSTASSGEHKGSGMPMVDSDTCIMTQESIADVDEFLIIFDGEVTCGTGNMGQNSNSNIHISLYNVATKEEKSTIQFGEGCGQNAFINKIYPPRLVKLMNNFDGTYTTYNTLGVGDIYIKDKTVDAKSLGNDIRLRICSYSQASNRASAKSSIKIYNIITKRLETAVCSAQEVMTADGGCQKLDSLLLAHENAIYESVQQQIQRISDRLQARQISIEARISDLENYMSLAEKQEKITWIDNKIIELETQRNNAEFLKSQEIASLQAAFTATEEALESTTIDAGRKKLLTATLEGTRKELAYIETLDVSKEYNDQIAFYKNQKVLLETSPEAKISELQNELELTKAILSGIQSGQIKVSADQNIEEAITEVKQQIESNQLTEAQIKAMVGSAQKTTILIVAGIVIVLIIVLLIAFRRKR